MDDNPGVLDLLQTVFSSAGYSVDAAPNGFSALMRVSKRPDHFQLIMTDLRMPGMDGIALIEQSRQAGYLGPIIVYAASIESDMRVRLRDLRVTQIIDKPARAGELINAVREAQSGF